MLLFKACTVFAPEPLGVRDVLIGGGKILAIETNLDPMPVKGLKTINAKGLIMIPGLIDSHVHIAGAGGEGGPGTRTPEMSLKQMLEGGITSVVGCLGTDGMTRRLESVLMKVKALRQSGVSAWMYTGSYQVPPPTILEDAGRDIAIIDEVIGVGEIAIADHRSSCPSVRELARLASQARVGGMLGGKAGIMNLHIGDAANPFEMIYQVLKISEVPVTQFMPTHCNRNRGIFEDAKTYGKEGLVDLTTCSYHYYPDVEVKPSEGVVRLIEAGVPMEHITMSSDACGSLPEFDDSGNLVKLRTGQPKTLFKEFIDLVRQEDWPMDRAAPVVTSNVAQHLKLHAKGRIKPGMDGDTVLLDENHNIVHLTANGTLMIEDGTIIAKSNF